ncbi:DUF429 domain-containing protein [Hyphomicrobium sp.]|uniref:DUF429 domain-containing protein n=1 Tax=Hyphomicrobium sp. TaxID=82 RepID=UPI003F702BA6
MGRFVGIDFSGGAAPWRSRVSRPTVWVAVTDGRSLLELRPVHELEGEGLPYHRLARLLEAADFDAAAIDAPFCLPVKHLPPGGFAALLREVALISNGDDRPFPRGAEILALGERYAPKDRAKPKPLRATEAYWASRGVNTRSTMWNGPRGGAPFAAACLRMIGLTGRPCWPWNAATRGVLVEAFPAAQLRHWGMAHTRYGAKAAVAERAALVEQIRNKIEISIPYADKMIQSPDALDAVVASFAAFAVGNGTVGAFEAAHADGVIAVAD